MSNFLEKFWNLLQGIFDHLEGEWHKLEQPIKNALMWASGVVATITTNLNATPQFVLDLIEQKFPGVDIEKVKAALAEVTKNISTIETVPGETIDVTLANLQKYFAGLGDKEWQAEASTIAQKLAAMLAPNAPFATFTMFIEYVYQRFIKK